MALSVPGISINDVAIAIVPNSYKSVSGQGEIKVTSTSNGGNSVEIIHTEDAENKFGKVSFKVKNTNENKDRFLLLKPLIQGIRVQATQLFQTGETLNAGSFLNDPDWEASADGEVEWEFAGDPLAYAQ